MLFLQSMKRIAIVTGASSGMGREFARTAADHVEFDELWVVARRADRLEALAGELKGKTTVVPVPLDLEDSGAADALGAKLAG